MTTTRAPCKRCCASGSAPLTRKLEQLAHSFFDARTQHVDIRRVVVVAGDTEVDLTVIRKDGDGNADLTEQRYIGVGLEHPATGHVQRELRTRDVGGSGIDVAL